MVATKSPKQLVKTKFASVTANFFGDIVATTLVTPRYHHCDVRMKTVTLRLAILKC